MRRLFVRLHRWFGLFTALFLFVAGLTGAVISWDHELDEWLNPHFYVAHSTTEPTRSAFEMVAELERDEPRMRATYFPLNLQAGHALQVFVEAKIDPTTQKPYELGFNQLALDPVSGHVQARRMWGDISLRRENILSFLYRLHYSLHLPQAWGLDLGILWMGLIGVVWALDCLIALYVAFPTPKHWRRSLKFRWREGGNRLNFDLHRSGGVWAWALLLVVAVTSVSMNLNQEVVRPIVGLFSPLSPNPFEERSMAASSAEVAEPRVSRERIVELARAQAEAEHLTKPAGGLFYAPLYGLYGVGFFSPGNDHGDGGLGVAWIYFDAQTGEAAGSVLPGRGSWGDLFMQAQFPLHSGRIAGIYGRILISALGVVIALLSVTGMILWAKRRWRAQLASKSVPVPESLKPGSPRWLITQEAHYERTQQAP